MLLCIYVIACLIELLALLSVELKGSFLVLNYSVQYNMFVTEGKTFSTRHRRLDAFPPS